MGIFSKQSSAVVYNDGRYFKDGLYLNKIIGVRLNEGGFKGDTIVIECEVLAVKNQISDDAPKVGDTAVQILLFPDKGVKRDMALNNWMQFLTSTLECKVKDHDDATWEEIANSVIDGAFDDKILVMEAITKPTKDGGEFTKCVWKGVATEEDFVKFGYAA